MPVGYLLPALLFAWCTLCAVGPARWQLAPGRVRYLSALVISELPVIAIYWLLALTAFTLAQGGLNTRAGWLAAGLTGAAVAGLAIVAARQTRAGSSLDAALATGLGARWQETLGAGAAGQLRPGFAVSPVLFLPLRARGHGVRRISDIRYGDAGAANLLDVYQRRSHPAGCPILVHLHGGELRSGRKNHEGLPLIYGLARRGWVCISANYRLSPGATFPEHLIDVKKVIAWARTHGAEYGADPSLIFLAGVSAGAQLTALAACTAGEPEYQPGFETADTAISGAVTLSGLYGPRSVPGAGPGSSALPCAHVHPQVPPFFIAHGDMDSVLAVEGARDFASALRRVSRSPVVYAELRGAQHSFDLFRSLYADNLVSAVESFATWVHAHEKQGHHRLQSGRQSSIESGGGARGVHQ